MSIRVRLRRPAVTLGVVLALLAGAATIQAAAAWTAANAPLVDRPPSVDELRAALTAEHERSLELQSQLDQISAGSADLAAALLEARDRIAQDADQARALQASLAAAKAKLSALERSIRQARATAPAPAGAPVAAAAPVSSGQDLDGRHEGGDDD